MRVFAGLPLPSEISGIIAEWMKGWKAGSTVKRVERENLHITLLFFGERSEEQVRELEAALEPIEYPAIEATLGQVARFPPDGSPRVFFIDLDRGREEAQGLHRLLLRSLGPLTETGGGRRYTPHITVGRTRRDRIAAAAPPFDEYRGRPLLLDRMILFESRLSPKGPVYRPLKTVFFGRSASRGGDG